MQASRLFTGIDIEGAKISNLGGTQQSIARDLLGIVLVGFFLLGPGGFFTLKPLQQLGSPEELLLYDLHPRLQVFFFQNGLVVALLEFHQQILNFQQVSPLLLQGSNLLLQDFFGF